MAQPPVHQLFRAAAARYAGRTAIDAGARLLTYRQLAARVDELGAALAACGAGAEPVAILSRHSDEVIAAELAVLEAGGAFVPLDPSFPATTLPAVLGEVRPRVWLADPEEIEPLRRAAAACGFAPLVVPLTPGAADVGSAPVPAAAGERDPEGFCYLYFTSGSTGRPKAIAGRLKAIDHFVRWEVERFAIDSAARVSQLTSPAFDAFLRDAFVPLSTGGAVCVPPDRETLLGGGELAAWIDAARLTLVHCTPSLFRLLLAQKLVPEQFAALRHVLLAGEPLLPADVRAWYGTFGDRIQLVNLYGPSETTMVKLFHPVPAADGGARVVPVGMPMPGARAIVVGDDGQPCPPGKLGELYIRTPYRSLGYYNRPELSREVFVQNPWSDRADDIVYKTGDLGRVRDDGNFEVLGRRDMQVKVRGVRVELAPIEERLRAHPGVAEAAVVDRLDNQGNRFLCAYVAPRDRVAAGELAAYLAAELPAAMIPSAFVTLAALPRTLSGKLDRRALPSPGQQEREYAPPRNAVEETLCRLFAETLAVPRVGVDDSFFELGGHSLLVTQLLARVRAELASVPLGQVFRTPTVAGLARAIAEQAAPPPLAAAAPPPAEAGAPLSYSQLGLWVIDEMRPAESVAYHIAHAVRLRGRIDVAALRRALAAVVARHDALRTTYMRRGDEPVQVVAAAGQAALPLLDLTALPAPRRPALAREVAAAEARRGFRLQSGPLLRALLVRLGAEEHVLALVGHHIIADAWSMVVLVRDLTVSYLALRGGQPPPLAALPVQFASFAAWQRQLLAGPLLDAERAYWRAKLKGAPAFVDLPTDRPRPAVPNFRAGRETFLLEPAQVAGLAQLAASTECTPFMVFLAAFAALIRYHTAADDLVINAPISYRERREHEDLIGFLANTLLLRLDLAGDPSFRTLLGRVREVVLEAYDHQHLPLGMAIRDATPERRPGTLPLRQLSLNYVHHDLARGARAEIAAGAAGGEVEIEDFDLGFANAPTELGLVLAQREAAMHGTVNYRLELLDAPTVVELIARFRHLLAQVVAQPELRLGDLALALAEHDSARRASRHAAVDSSLAASLRQRGRR